MSEKKRKYLKKKLLAAKEEGLRVFMTDFKESAYGIVSDGTNILYVQVDPYCGGLKTSFVYRPDKSTGDCCNTVEDGYGYAKITKEVFNEAASIGRGLAARYGASLYDNLEEYFKDSFHAAHYKEL